ncbi:unnamed protein product [Citrullus colocynthis]|uniref:Fatty acid desaturase domain-containing protein n=1 Tax=Citrullus colocynthis TaxID=252529 RepID=A0ABP0YW36_9ROSI
MKYGRPNNVADMEKQAFYRFVHDAYFLHPIALGVLLYILEEHHFLYGEWWISLFSFGESWHHNHHAFEYSARMGIEWWQVDIGWYVILFRQAIGLATDVKQPSLTHKQRLAMDIKLNEAFPE